MIGKIVRRNGKAVEIKITACMSSSLLHRETIESAMIKHRDLNDQGAEG